MDIADYNSRAWDSLVEKRDKWTVPVDAEVIARARSGDWSILVTALKPVPRDWFLARSGPRSEAGGRSDYLI